MARSPRWAARKEPKRGGTGGNAVTKARKQQRGQDIYTPKWTDAGVIPIIRKHTRRRGAPPGQPPVSVQRQCQDQANRTAELGREGVCVVRRDRSALILGTLAPVAGAGTQYAHALFAGTPVRTPPVRCDSRPSLAEGPCRRAHPSSDALAKAPRPLYRPHFLAGILYMCVHCLFVNGRWQAGARRLEPF